MLLITNLMIGAIIISVTVVIHAIMCDFIFRFIENKSHFFIRLFKKSWKICVLIVSVFMIGAALMADIWIWTILFYSLEPSILEDIETALYFSTITFTTVGFGDIVLSPHWRLLSSCAAINGMILFGWSTAFLFEIMTTIYKPIEKKWIKGENQQGK